MASKLFSCDQCGACCSHLRLFGKPYAWLLDESSGMCRYYDPQTRLCAIYPIRPIICNMRIGYEVYFSHMAWGDFVKQNMAACEMLKKLP